MARQWDTKKKFEPDYRGVARLVFLGWLRATREPEYRSIASELADALFRIGGALLGIAIGFLLLVTSPLSFPAICLIHRASLRGKRLRYIQRNRKADADI